MSLTLFRIDERLLHGQVIVGWGMRLGIDHYLVVDDALSESDWEQDLYSAGLPDGVSVEFLTTARVIERFEEINARRGKGALLTRDTAVMRKLAEAGCLEGRRVNLGGLHAGEGRRRALRYVHLRSDEVSDLKAIEQRAGMVSARDLPTGKEVALEELIDALD